MKNIKNIITLIISLIAIQETHISAMTNYEARYYEKCAIRSASKDLLRTLRSNPTNFNNKSTTSLDFYQTDITTEELFTIITNCENLQNLDLSFCRNAVKDIINTQAKCCPPLLNLKKLNLTGTNISSEAFCSSLNLCPNLKELNLTQLSYSTIDDMADFLYSQPSKTGLKNISLYGTYITPKALCKIIISCPDLEVLDLTFCDSAYEGIALALKENPNALVNLKKINLYKTIDYNTKQYSHPEYTSCKFTKIKKTFIALVLACPKLKELNLGSCYYVYDLMKTLINEGLIDKLNLEILDLTNVDMNRDDFCEIKKNYPTTTILAHKRLLS